MADIERWITVNGAHVPIMKGESAAKAVGRFIKSKKSTKRTVLNNKKYELAEKLNKAYSGDGDPSERKDLEYDYKDVQDKLSKLNERRNIKGYNTDPYNRVNKAQAARIKASRENQWDTDQAYALLRTIRGDAKETLDNQIDYIYDKQRANPSRLEKAKTAYKVQQLNNEYDAKLANAEYLYGKAKAKQSKAMDDATFKELNREYKGYRWSGRNDFAPKVSRALTKLDTNKGVRIDGMAWKKVGPDKFMNENGFKINKWDMANEISKAKEVKYYKKWLD